MKLRRLLILVIIHSATISAQENDSTLNPLYGMYDVNGDRVSHQLILDQDCTYNELYQKYIGYHPLTVEIWGQYELTSNTIVMKPDSITLYREHSKFPSEDTLAIPPDLEKHNDTLLVIPYRKNIYLVNVNTIGQNSGECNNIESFIEYCVESNDQPHHIFPFLSKECQICSTPDVESFIQELRESLIIMYSRTK